LPELRLYVDGDSVPVPIRAVILRCAKRTGLPTLFVADRLLKDVQCAKEEDTHERRLKAEAAGTGDEESLRNIRSVIGQVLVPSGQDSADNYLVEHVETPALAITHDIPLAYRLVEKDVVVLDDRGHVYTKENVGERLSERNVNMLLREWGMGDERTKPLSASQVKAFADALDRTLTHMR